MSPRPPRSVPALAAVLLVAIVACIDSGDALCPSNGNTHAIYITSNMGDNIWSFDTLGNYLGPVINEASFPPGVQVRKLRSMRFGPAGHLYVSSAHGSYSRVFAVSGNGLLNRTMEANCTRDYLFTVVEQDKANPFLDHPYDIAFHPVTEDMYVSNQNSVTVTRYNRDPTADVKPKAGAGGLPRARYPAWKPAKNVKAAVEASEETTSMEETPTTRSITDNAGLFASSWSSSYSMSSVRGLTISPQLPRTLVEGGDSPGVFAVTNESMMYYLLVCDVSRNTVHVFDAESGERLFGLSVPSPIQVMFPSRYYISDSSSLSVSPAGVLMRNFDVPYIYVTSKEDGMAYMLRFSSREGNPNNNGMQDNAFGEGLIRAHRLYTINRPLPLHAASGIYENPARDVLLIADRNGRRVYSYASPFLTDYTNGYGPSPFLSYFVQHLPDQPEFIMSALLEHQGSIPFCYELKGDGKFRYVALCTAASIWSVALALALVIVPSFIAYRQIQNCLHGQKHHQPRHLSLDEEALALYRSGNSSPLLARQAPNYGSAK
ncbi:hypothetical protein GH5_00183 [Leishmania sp. Ghana 2012 LV757]|uniref:hypothetical protein n=1 Tax=Leishmania sp. Ghana 2012 LV757 TaxID=2803181 RepID=UPI001B7C2F0B|nr:hypothetical protein GH5_00183 [Leishmania sp. Ghana 2012 LV757]